jgi:hypothetical protein
LKLCSQAQARSTWGAKLGARTETSPICRQDPNFGTPHACRRLEAVKVAAWFHDRPDSGYIFLDDPAGPLTVWATRHLGRSTSHLNAGSGVVEVAERLGGGALTLAGISPNPTLYAHLSDEGRAVVAAHATNQLVKLGKVLRGLPLELTDDRAVPIAIIVPAAANTLENQLEALCRDLHRRSYEGGDPEHYLCEVCAAGHIAFTHACGVPKLASCLQVADFSARAPSLGTPTGWR